LDLISHWITQYGYAGIFTLLVLGIVGLPVPDETLLTFAGYLVSRGQLKLAPVLTAAVLGSVCGITVSYALGRVTGYLLIEKYGAKLHLRMEYVQRVHDWFRRLGRFTLTIGYYVPGVRHLTAYVAGASKLEWPVFAVFAYTGAAIWTSSFIALGYLVGEQWQQISGDMHRYALWGAAILGAVVLCWWTWRRFARPLP